MLDEQLERHLERDADLPQDRLHERIELRIRPRSFVCFIVFAGPESSTSRASGERRAPCRALRIASSVLRIAHVWRIDRLVVPPLPT
jgi:hypothetical protein